MRSVLAVFALLFIGANGVGLYPEDKKPLTACIPELDGFIKVIYFQKKSTGGKDKFETHLNFQLKGLGRRETGQIIIHEGTSCTTIGGEYWNADKLDSNPWTSDVGYTAKKKGKAKSKGDIQVSNGYAKGDNEGHAIVVYTEAGNYCGILTKDPDC